jgi:hypothetical protein
MSRGDSGPPPSGSGAGLSLDGAIGVEVIWPWLASTGAGLAFFAFLVRRRREYEPVAAAAMASATPTATAVASPAVAQPVPRLTLPPMRELIPPVDHGLLADAEARPDLRPEEVGVPRWLRPSVRAARFDGVRDRPRLNWDG